MITQLPSRMVGELYIIMQVTWWDTVMRWWYMVCSEGDAVRSNGDAVCSEGDTVRDLQGHRRFLNI